MFAARNVGRVLVIQQAGNDVTITRRDRFDLASVGNANRLEEEQLQPW
jgi:hypothetical protein